MFWKKPDSSSFKTQNFATFQPPRKQLTAYPDNPMINQLRRLSPWRIVTKNFFKMVLLFLSTATASFIVARLAFGGAKLVANTFFPEENEASDEAIIAPIPEFIDLQSTVDEWLKGVSGEVGLMIYDLDNQKIAAEYQPNKIFYAASVYKLFFAYDGYKQIDNASSSSSDSDNQAQSLADEYFVTTYDYRAGRYSYGECLDLIIRESYNGCAEPMRNDKTTFTRIEDFSEQLGLVDTSAAGLYSSAADLTTLLKYYWQHDDLSEEQWQKLTDSMLNQPPTKNEDEIEDWRQGLPAGFSVAKVYNKVGWLYGKKGWESYNDVALVDFTEQNRHYSVVVLTKNVASATKIAELGTTIEQKVLAN